MAETLTYDNTPDAEVLTPDEQDSLQIGEQLEVEQEQLLAGKYQNAEELERAYIELQKKLGDTDEDADETTESVETSDEPDPEVSPVQSFIIDASAEFSEKGQLYEELMSKLS